MLGELQPWLLLFLFPGCLRPHWCRARHSLSIAPKGKPSQVPLRKEMFAGPFERPDITLDGIFPVYDRNAMARWAPEIKDILGKDPVQGGVHGKQGGIFFHK